ncbi:unnamed protein product [marine sediment metagenome]|uniref:Uncharacterized protein n=1 Tax=marine sediment metagenome TaxID=412755 RepID=X1SMF5_9ZZZZ
MALTLRQWIDYAQTEYNAAYGSGCAVGYYLRRCGEQLQAGNLDNAGEMIYIAGTNMYDFADEALSRYSHQKFRIINALYWIDDNWPDGDGVTMSAILEAMKNAEPHQPLLFMAYLEAYKASVWNATFDETFFANLVRKWLIWG